MRDAFGSTLIFIIVIIFITLFCGYICISINQTKAYNVKNEIVEALERNGSYTKLNFRTSVAKAFDKQGYRMEGKCPLGSIACDRSGNCPVLGNTGAFCITPHKSKSGVLNTTYYTITTFYQLNIPIISHYVPLTTEGDTKMMLDSASDCSICGSADH